MADEDAAVVDAFFLEAALRVEAPVRSEVGVGVGRRAGAGVGARVAISAAKRSMSGLLRIRSSRSASAGMGDSV